jgi:hypothetical protein
MLLMNITEVCKSILFLCMLFTFDSFALDCSKTVKIKYLQDRKENIIKKNVCLMKNGRSFVSKECLKTCQANSNKKTSQNLIQGLGSPSHIECHQFGGKPLISVVTLEKETFNSVVCLFEDKSLLTTDLLGKSNEN